ncbi:MAG: hypothetical protein R2849_04545 [Thermomicrobiales bacterium]
MERRHGTLPASDAVQWRYRRRRRRREILARGTAGIESYDWGGGAWNDQGRISRLERHWVAGIDQPQYY